MNNFENNKDRIRKNLELTYFGNTSDNELEKGGKRANLGDKRTWGGIEYERVSEKQKDGGFWKRIGKSTEKSPSSEVKQPENLKDLYKKVDESIQIAKRAEKKGDIELKTSALETARIYQEKIDNIESLKTSSTKSEPKDDKSTNNKTVTSSSGKILTLEEGSRVIVSKNGGPADWGFNVRSFDGKNLIEKTTNWEGKPMLQSWTRDGKTNKFYLTNRNGIGVNKEKWITIADYSSITQKVPDKKETSTEKK